MKEEWNNMSEEFILKACKLFRKRVDTIIEKMAAILKNLQFYANLLILLFIF